MIFDTARISTLSVSFPKTSCSFSRSRAFHPPPSGGRRVRRSGVHHVPLRLLPPDLAGPLIHYGRVLLLLPGLFLLAIPVALGHLRADRVAGSGEEDVLEAIPGDATRRPEIPLIHLELRLMMRRLEVRRLTMQDIMDGAMDVRDKERYGGKWRTLAWAPKTLSVLLQWNEVRAQLIAEAKAENSKAEVPEVFLIYRREAPCPPMGTRGWTSCCTTRPMERASTGSSGTTRFGGPGRGLLRKRIRTAYRRSWTCSVTRTRRTR